MIAKTGKQCQFGQDMTYLTIICSVYKNFQSYFVVLEVSVAHVTYRATVTVTLHTGPHECKNRQTVSIWSRYDISYHNLLSRKVSMQILWYFRYRLRTLHIGPHECKSRQTVSIWSRYHISYHNLQCRKVFNYILWY